MTTRLHPIPSPRSSEFEATAPTIAVKIPLVGPQLAPLRFAPETRLPGAEVLSEVESITVGVGPDDSRTTARRRLRIALAARVRTRRLNRQFTRDQRDFHRALDHCPDPSSQRELQTSWSLRS